MENVTGMNAERTAVEGMSRRGFVGVAAGMAAAAGLGLAGEALASEAAPTEGEAEPVAEDDAASADAASSIETPTPAYQVDVYDLGDLRLHALGSLDALGDVCYLVESDDALVGIEMPPFTEDLEAWARYTDSLGKPLAGVFTDNHTGGTEYLEGVEVYATQNAYDSQLSGSVYATASGLGQTFGEDFHTDVPAVTQVIGDGSVTVGGVEFEVMDDGDTYRLAIPAMNVVYTHMLGETTHSILASVEAIDAFEAQLRDYQAKGYALVLTSHHMPEGQQAVAAKIAYLEKARELATSCANAEEWTSAMQEAFPGYDGESYLEMSAGYLFSEA